MERKNERLFALVQTGASRPKVRHVLGFPPELIRETDEARPLPAPDVLLIREESEGSVFLHRLTAHGDPCGDTWHQSVGDARNQATYEFGDAIGLWQYIPFDVTDPLNHALQAAKRQVADGA